MAAAEEADVRLVAAIRLGRSLGLAVERPVVLRDLGSYVVHLAPSPVVARVVSAAAADLDALRRELAVTTHLAAQGAAVAAPWSDPGPHHVGEGSDQHVVTLGKHVDHDPGRPLDAAAAGRCLRVVHDLLADETFEGLPHFARLDEGRAIVDALHEELAAADAAALAEMLDRATVTLARLDLTLQPVHGDAYLGNVLRTVGGPVWGDFEKVCLGPRELDLACNETAARHRGRGPDDDAFRAGYGDHDADLVARLEPLERVPLTAWTFRLAAERPAYLQVARRRLAWALEGLRGPGG